MASSADAQQSDLLMQRTEELRHLNQSYFRQLGSYMADHYLLWNGRLCSYCSQEEYLRDLHLYPPPDRFYKRYLDDPTVDENHLVRGAQTLGNFMTTEIFRRWPKERFELLNARSVMSYTVYLITRAEFALTSTSGSHTHIDRVSNIYHDIMLHVGRSRIKYTDYGSMIYIAAPDGGLVSRLTVEDLGWRPGGPEPRTVFAGEYLHNPSPAAILARPFHPQHTPVQQPPTASPLLATAPPAPQPSPALVQLPSPVRLAEPGDHLMTDSASPGSPRSSAHPSNRSPTKSPTPSPPPLSKLARSHALFPLCPEPAISTILRGDTMLIDLLGAWIDKYGPRTARAIWRSPAQRDIPLPAGRRSEVQKKHLARHTCVAALVIASHGERIGGLGERGVCAYCRDSGKRWIDGCFVHEGLKAGKCANCVWNGRMESCFPEKEDEEEEEEGDGEE